MRATGLHGRTFKEVSRGVRWESSEGILFETTAVVVTSFQVCCNRCSRLPFDIHKCCNCCCGFCGRSWHGHYLWHATTAGVAPDASSELQHLRTREMLVPHMAHIDSCFHRHALWALPLFLPCPSGLLFLCPHLCRPSSLAKEEVLTAREVRTVQEEPWDDAAAERWRGLREQHLRSRQAGPNFLFDAQRPGQLTKAPPGCPYRGNGLAFYPRCGSRTRTTRRVSTAGRKVPSDGL